MNARENFYGGERGQALSAQMAILKILPLGKYKPLGEIVIIPTLGRGHCPIWFINRNPSAIRQSPPFFLDKTLHNPLFEPQSRVGFIGPEIEAKYLVNYTLPRPPPLVS